MKNANPQNPWIIASATDDLFTASILKPGLVVRYSIQNAINLIDEAGLLDTNKRYARANLLALLALEEIAKADLIYRHSHRGHNKSLEKDLVSHHVKFGSKDKITKVPRHNLVFILKANKDAFKDKQDREDSMYVGVRNKKLIRPSLISADKAKKNIQRAKESMYFLYLEHITTVWPKYDVQLPKPPYFIKVEEGYESLYIRARD